MIQTYIITMDIEMFNITAQPNKKGHYYQEKVEVLKKN